MARRRTKKHATNAGQRRARKTARRRATIMSESSEERNARELRRSLAVVTGKMLLDDLGDRGHMAFARRRSRRAVELSSSA